MEKMNKAKQIADHYGLASRMAIAQEECAELIQAISKVRRAEMAGDYGVNYVVARTNLSEKMADVANLLMQLTHLLNNKPMVEFWLEQKLDRTLWDIRKEEAGA